MSDTPPPAPSGEDALLDRVLQQMRASHPSAVTLGPGHDCAALSIDAASVVVTTDVLIDGVHFVLGDATPAAVARKALAVNLSDLAAAAAIPVGFVVGGVLPRPLDPMLFEALTLGFVEAAEAFGCACVGGDTNVADGPLVLAVTAIGRAGPAGVLSRAGARPGMRLSVTGPLGGSNHGRHLHVTPRVAEAQALAARDVPRAMMDVSDGLALDLSRLCRASDVGVRLVAEQIPIHPDVRASGESALHHALADGEDFELLVAHDELDESVRSELAEQGVTLTEIGRFTDAAEGCVLVHASRVVPLKPEGFDHVR